jgi:lipopolysaccharide export LptBFGC system permease protein LptF
MIGPSPGVANVQRRKLRVRAGLGILSAAFASFLLSVTLWFTGQHEQGAFVGLWVPSILAFGVVALLMIGDSRE